jgi:DNA polymerase
MREILEYLRDLGFEDLYRSKVVPPSPSASQRSRPAANESFPDRAEALSSLCEAVQGCERCELSRSRQKVVFGSGDGSADLMFIGEAPGAQEDRQGLPFVGPAGELLTRIIQAIDLRREDVYIANIVKCRPPGNRDPLPDEVASCRGYLEQQIALVQPRVIVALGKVAAQTLLGMDETLGRMRGRWYDVLDVPTRVTYHPAGVLRNSQWRRPVWEDMQVVRDKLKAGEGGD